MNFSSGGNIYRRTDPDPAPKQCADMGMASLLVFAPVGLLMLLARGYHTLLLILVGVMFAIGALTFFYTGAIRSWGLPS